MTCRRRAIYPAILRRENNKYLGTYRQNRSQSWQEAEADDIIQLALGATINYSATTFARSGANTTTARSDTLKAPNFITEITTRTRAISCAAFNYNTPAYNETQRLNFFTGGSQHAAPQAAQTVAPQVNYDDDDGIDGNNVLPKILYEHGF